jgi:hypothetical protein
MRRNQLLEFGYRLCKTLITYGASPANLNDAGDSLLHVLIRLGEFPDYERGGSSPMRILQFHDIVKVCKQRGVTFMTLNANKESALMLLDADTLYRWTFRRDSPLDDQERKEAEKLFNKLNAKKK